MNDRTLTEAEIADLRCLAGTIIPPSAKYSVPGADDDTIFSDIVNSIGRDRNDVRAALAKLRTLTGGPFAMLNTARRREVTAKLRAEGGAQRRGRPSPRATCSSRATGRCSTQCEPASPSGARRRRDRFSIVATRGPRHAEVTTTEHHSDCRR